MTLAHSWNALALRLCLFGLLVATVASGALLHAEHAVVTVSVVARPVAVKDAVLNGGSEGLALAVSRLTAAVTEKQTGSSSSTAVPGTLATGLVTFSCSPMTSCPNGYTVQAGTLLESTTGVRYRTQSAASFPSCAPSSPVVISAISPGAAGNAGAGTVVYGQFPGYIHVTNPWAVTGGTDAHTVPLVRQSDLDAVGSALTARVSSELATQLKAEAGELDYVAAGAPQFTVTSDVHAGAETPAFTVTVAGTLQAAAFSRNGATLMMRRALAQRVPAGYRLLSDPLEAVFSVQEAATVTGSASGYMVPAVDASALTTAIRGQRASTAEAWLRGEVPDATVHIQMTPFTLPWLPIVSGNISVQVLVQAAA